MKRQLPQEEKIKKNADGNDNQQQPSSLLKAAAADYSSTISKIDYSNISTSAQQIVEGQFDDASSPETGQFDDAPDEEINRRRKLLEGAHKRVETVRKQLPMMESYNEGTSSRNDSTFAEKEGSVGAVVQPNLVSFEESSPPKDKDGSTFGIPRTQVVATGSKGGKDPPTSSFSKTGGNLNSNLEATTGASSSNTFYNTTTTRGTASSMSSSSPQQVIDFRSTIGASTSTVRSSTAYDRSNSPHLHSHHQHYQNRHYQFSQHYPPPPSNRPNWSHQQQQHYHPYFNHSPYPPFAPPGPPHHHQFHHPSERRRGSPSSSTPPPYWGSASISASPSPYIIGSNRQQGEEWIRGPGSGLGSASGPAPSSSSNPLLGKPGSSSIEIDAEDEKENDNNNNDTTCTIEESKMPPLNVNVNELQQQHPRRMPIEYEIADMSMPGLPGPSSGLNPTSVSMSMGAEYDEVGGGGSKMPPLDQQPPRIPLPLDAARGNQHQGQQGEGQIQTLGQKHQHRHDLDQDEHEHQEEERIYPSDVTANDVLMGRGGGTNRHNTHFRALVSEAQPQYVQARKKDKTRIAKSIVATIRSRGGRFLKMHPDGYYWDVGDRQATLKTSQALREGLSGRMREIVKESGTYLLKKGK